VKAGYTVYLTDSGQDPHKDVLENVIALIESMPSLLVSPNIPPHNVTRSPAEDNGKNYGNRRRLEALLGHQRRKKGRQDTTPALS